MPNGPEIMTLFKMPPTPQAALEEKYVCHQFQGSGPAMEIEADRAAGIRGLVTAAFMPTPGELFAKLPNLEVISSFGVGYDKLDVEAAKTRNIPCGYTPDCLTSEVANQALILLMTTVRRTLLADRYLRDGRWLGEGSMAFTDGLTGQKGGVVGLGRIGAAIAKRLDAIDVNVSWHGPRRKEAPWPYYEDLDAMARDVDFLMVACPGSEETRGLIDARVLEALGPKGYVVNISRGFVIDEPAMITALRDGKIAGAGLDVFAQEPKVPDELMAMDNVVLTPHVGSATVPTRDAMGFNVIENLDAHFAGQPLVTPIP